MPNGSRQSHINHLIRISKLCEKYPKIAQTSLELGVFKNYMSYFVSRIEQDSEFWLSA